MKNITRFLCSLRVYVCLVTALCANDAEQPKKTVSFTTVIRMDQSRKGQSKNDMFNFNASAFGGEKKKKTKMKNTQKNK